MVSRLGFNDIAGWSRFTNRLLGRSPRQIPLLPLESLGAHCGQRHLFRASSERATSGADTKGLKRQ